MTTYTYYEELKKPRWSPPARVFGPVWSVLYILIAISFGKVFLSAWSGAVPAFVVLPFVLNLIFNFAYTTIQFKLKNNLLASLDILLVLGTLIWAMLAILSLGGVGITWVAYINIPYLLWVAFATVLQLTITYLNK